MHMPKTASAISFLVSKESESPFPLSLGGKSYSMIFSTQKEPENSKHCGIIAYPRFFQVLMHLQLVPSWNVKLFWWTFEGLCQDMMTYLPDVSDGVNSLCQTRY